MSIFDEATGVDGVSSPGTPGAESASPVPPNEPGATGQPTSEPTSKVPEAQGTGVADQTGAATPPPVATPPALTEEQLTQIESGLPSNAGQAFAQFRTQNRDLSLKVETLTQQLADTEPAPGSIVIDAPADEWNPIPQIEKMPDPYYHKLANIFTDYHFADRAEKILIQDYENLPVPAQQQIANAFMQRLEKDTGLNGVQIFEAIDQYKQSGGQGTDAGAQGSASQSSYVKKLLDLGYEEDDPLVIEANQRERELGLLRGQVKQLEGRFQQFDSSNQVTAQQRHAQEVQAREQEFQTKTSGVQGSVLDPIKKAIPQGYEQAYDFIEARALRQIENDAVAKTHLENARGAFDRAGKFKAQGTPQLAEREMRRHTGEMAKYAALFAIKAQAAAKFVMSDLVGQNVDFKRRFGNGLAGRREMVGGAAATAIGANGRPIRVQGETDEAFALRNRSYLIAKLEASQPPGPGGM